MSLADAYFNAGNQLGGFTTFSVAGQTYTVPIMTTVPGQKAEGIANSFEGYCLNGLMGNSVVYSLAAVRVRVFSEARFQYQRMSKGRPADLWSDKSLALLDHPWPGGVTGDLLAIMMLHADFAGNCYVAHLNGQLVVLRPDWVDIILAERMWTDMRGHRGVVGMEKVGYAYYQGGKQTGVQPMMFGAEDVAHFAPQADPLANYRGMSWLTPVIREIRGDNAAMDHKLAFFENASTPNLAVSLQGITDPDQFNKFVDAMDNAHAGVQNAYKTLYLGAGADVTVIGSSLKDMDFSTIQGKGETRLASAAGVPPSVAGLSEGLQGSSLNAGNFGQARRQFADMTLSPLWRNAAGSLETIIQPPDSGSRLWYDTRDIPFLREDQIDLAGIQQQKSQAIRELFQAGFTAESCVLAINSDDLSLLVHTGVYSIQVQTPGQMSPKLPSTVDEPPLGPDESGVDVQKALPAAPVQGALVAAKASGRGLYDDAQRQDWTWPEWMLATRRDQPDVNVTMPAVTINLTVEPAGVTVQPAEVTVEPAEITVNVEATQVRVEPPAVNVEAPNVYVDVPAPQVTVEPAEVTVNVEAPQVRVEPPQVNVEAPNVYVDAPPPAEVTVNVNAPPPRSRSVERDANGDITRIVEEDQ